MINYLVLTLAVTALVLLVANEIWSFFYPRCAQSKPLYQRGDIVAWTQFKSPTNIPYYVMHITDVDESTSTWRYSGEVFFVSSLKRNRLTAWCPRVSYERSVPERNLSSLDSLGLNRVIAKHGSKLYVSQVKA